MGTNENTFVAKVCRIGNKPHSFFIIIPKDVCRVLSLSFGDIAEFQFLRKVGHREYGMLNGFSVDKQTHQVTEEIRRMSLPNKHIQEAIREAQYYLSTLSPNRKRHTRKRSVAAVALYVSSINLSAEDFRYVGSDYRRLTQDELERFYNITTVTIRKHLRKGWNWLNGRFERKR